MVWSSRAALGRRLLQRSAGILNAERSSSGSFSSGSSSLAFLAAGIVVAGCNSDATWWAHQNPIHTTDCQTNHNKRAAKLERKKTALRVAASLQRMDTKEQLSTLQLMKKEMLQRWERDEEGWRKLPARAWPEYQPNPEELEGIVAKIQQLNCRERVFGNASSSDESCTKLLFDMATSLVFFNVDPPAGLALYERLARQGHADSMVACGIILVEGLGVPPREQEGFEWLERAMELSSSSSASAQAMYELGTVYYTGIDGVVEEDPEKAFALFERAAQYDHTAALYMVADCLVEGEGTERSIAKAVPLFYKAAERGHRYSRQRIRELLARVDYPL